MSSAELMRREYLNLQRVNVPFYAKRMLAPAGEHRTRKHCDVLIPRLFSAGSARVNGWIH